MLAGTNKGIWRHLVIQVCQFDALGCAKTTWIYHVIVPFFRHDRWASILHYWCVKRYSKALTHWQCSLYLNAALPLTPRLAYIHVRIHCICFSSILVPGWILRELNNNSTQVGATNPPRSCDWQPGQFKTHAVSWRNEIKKLTWPQNI